MTFDGSLSGFDLKGLEGFEIKDEARGEVVAVVSTLNIVDRDGDVILPGAIKDGSVVKLSAYGHDVITEGKAPVGRGVVTIKGDQAVLSARYFMSTDRGRDAFNTVKEMGADSEWSIGFPTKSIETAPMSATWKSQGARRLITGLTLVESSPVFRGANQHTGTLGAKAAGDDPPIDPPIDPPAGKTAAELQTEIAAARQTVGELEAKAANLAAAELFERFQRNFNQ